jgi:hypothetical protein
MAKKNDEVEEVKEPATVNVPATRDADGLPAVPDDPSDYPPDEELPLPRIGILQATSDAVTQEGRKAGVFLDDLTGEESAKITGIFLGMTRSRTRFVNKEPVCKAVDFKHGVGDPGGECAKCTLKDWDPDETKSTTERKPKCQESYDFVAVDSTEFKDGFPVGMPFIFSAAKTAIKPAKRLVGAARARGLPLYCFQVEVTVRRITNDQGTFYVPVFTVKGQTPPETWKNLADITGRLLAASKRTPATAPEGDGEPSEF